MAHRKKVNGCFLSPSPLGRKEDIPCFSFPIDFISFVQAPLTSIKCACMHTKSLQSCPILCDPMGCSSLQAPLSREFSRQEYSSGLPFPSPGDLPDPEIKPGSPTLQADSLLSEPSGKSKDTGLGSLFLLQGIFLT